MSEPDAVIAAADTDAAGATAESQEGFTAKVASSVIFVSDLDRSVEFYRDVFACELAIRGGDARPPCPGPGGFQMYLMARGVTAS